MKVHIRRNFMKLLFIKLSSVSLQICVSIFHLLFSFLVWPDYHFNNNYLDRQACANSIGPKSDAAEFKVKHIS